MRLCIAVLVVASLGCAPDGRESIDRQAAADSAATAAPDTGVATLDGRYTWGAEVNIFEPCGESATYWVTSQRGLTDSLRHRYERWVADAGPTPIPYSPMFARLVGRRSTEKGDGFAADYDGTFTVDSIVETRSLRPGDCAQR